MGIMSGRRRREAAKKVAAPKPVEKPVEKPKAAPKKAKPKKEELNGSDGKGKA